MKVKEIAISMCDCHLYEEHIDAVDIQLNRNPFNFPNIEITKEIDINISIEEKIKWIESLTFNDFNLINYNYHHNIKAVMK
jgi:thymidylate synthase